MVDEVGAASRQALGDLISDDEPCDRSAVNIQTFVFEVGHAEHFGRERELLLGSGSRSEL